MGVLYKWQSFVESVRDTDQRYGSLLDIERATHVAVSISTADALLWSRSTSAGDKAPAAAAAAELPGDS